MKITISTITLFISLVAGCCDPDCNYPDYNSYEIENNSIISIENNKNEFNIGETIQIQTNISTSQTTLSGETIDLSDFDYSDETSSYNHTLTLYKKSAYDTFSPIPLTNEAINVIQGNVTVEHQNLYISSTFNGTSYENVFTIKLLEPGEYMLAGPHFGTNYNTIYIYGGIYERGSVYIQTNIVNANDQGGYEFTVN